MSYSDSLSEEIMNIAFKKNCCRNAYLSTLLMTADLVDGSALVTLHREDVYLQMKDIFSRRYDAKNISSYTKNAFGRKVYIIKIDSNNCLNKIRELREENINFDDMFACEGCKGAFLRALFLAGGMMNDPKKQNHLEFRFASGSENVVKVLEYLGYQPKCIKRNNKTGIYFKNADSISDFLALAGLHQHLYEYYNAKIEKEIRNNENRATNCVAKNIEKAMEAGQKEIKVIEKYIEKGNLGKLPLKLQETIKIRMAYPDETLSELARMHNPPLTKSGMFHRMQTIMRIIKEEDNV